MAARMQVKTQNAQTLQTPDPTPFGVSVEGLQQLRDLSMPFGKTRRRVVNFGRGHQQETQIKQFVHKNTMLKFALMCRKLNLDPLHAHSVHVILLLFGKIRQKRALVEAYCAQHGVEDISIDWDAIHDGCGAYELSTKLEQEAETLSAQGEQLEVDKLFYATSDWQTMMNYLVPRVREDDSSDAMCDRNVQRMQTALVRAGLDEQAAVTSTLTLRALLFVMPGTLAASKMLERLFLQVAAESEPKRELVRDLEFRCLRALAEYNDTPLDEVGVTTTTLRVMAQMERTAIFDTDMRSVLESEHAVFAAPTSSEGAARVRLRDAVCAAAVSTASQAHGFRQWLAQQRFVITMSKQLQHLMYFIQVQAEPVPVESYQRHFSGDVLARLSVVPIQQIDADAVLLVIRSIRVCSVSIPDLITFRSTCLLGINSTRRLTITLPQVLQLYVAGFQHESIRRRCWCGIVDTWNHTIQDALRRFHEAHRFRAAEVIDTVVACQLKDDGGGKV